MTDLKVSAINSNKILSILLVFLFMTQASSLLVTQNIDKNSTIFLDGETVDQTATSPTWLSQSQSVPKLGLAGIELIAYHELSDEAVIHGNSSHSIGNTDDSETISGEHCMSQDYMNGQLRNLIIASFPVKIATVQALPKFYLLQQQM